MPEYKGLQKADKEKLEKAAVLYKNLLGEDLSGIVSSLPLAEDTDEQEKRRQQAQDDLDARAKVDKQLELARQEERRLRIQNDHLAAGNTGNSVFNQGPEAPATITEEAKKQGLKPASAPNNPASK